MNSREIIAAFEASTKWPLTPKNGDLFCFNFLGCSSQMFKYDESNHNWQTISPLHEMAGASDTIVLEQC